MDYRYWAAIQPDEDCGYLVTFPDVPDAITQGDDLSDTKRSAAEALGLALRGYQARGGALPRPAASGGALTEISVDPGNAVKMAVIEAFQASGLSRSELARRLGKGGNEARRILDREHPTRFDTLTAELAALGKRIVISVRDAA